jgi:probable selenium-dependent hydroxylase accessory protein YqeC
MKLTDAFGIADCEVISLVGGGGKTTLMFALARELAVAGRPVVTTTTTRIAAGEPATYGSPCLLVEKDGEQLPGLIAEKLKIHHQVTVVAENLSGQGKLRGLSADAVDRLAAAEPGCIIVEADGAAGRPVKAPKSGEPVFPQCTTLVIPVVGIDALGAVLDGEKVFRPEIVARLTGLAPGKTLTVEAIALLVTHAQGLTKGCPAGAKIIPFINKVESDDDRRWGIILAGKLLSDGHPRIEYVVLGRARSPDPVVEIVRMSGHFSGSG